MNNECKIKDDDEILEEELNRFNFRRFTQEEIVQKNNPFERFKKKDYTCSTFPFLFQKKKINKEEIKISLDDIINQVKDLSFNSITYSPRTPPYPPSPLSDYIDSSENYIVQSFIPNPIYDLSGNIINIPTLKLDSIIDLECPLIKPITINSLIE